MQRSVREHTVFGAVRLGIGGVRIEVQARFFEDPRAHAWEWQITGLAGPEVRECMARITGAFAKWGFEAPGGTILVNLAPAGLPKYGTSLDLPIALISLQAAGYLPDWSPEMEREHMFFGELGIHGDVRPVAGALPIAHAVGPKQTLVVPEGNEIEVAMVRATPEREGVRVGVVKDLQEAAKFVQGRAALRLARIGKEAKYSRATAAGTDFADIKGQERAKSALEVAAAGGHNVLMVGPPGEGKSLLASALPTILPPLSSAEKVELTSIYSAKGLIGEDGQIVVDRPFRAIHHSASRSALVGGGSKVPEPGEISLAHRGVLFLDELPEFPRSLLESLRQPLEAGQVTISRVGMSLEFPARVTLVAAMNPCPCGFAGQYECLDCLNVQAGRGAGCSHCGSARLSSRCQCSSGSVARYRKKLSGPLLDRIDMKVEVLPLSADEKLSQASGESSHVIRQRVLAARERQAKRYGDSGISCNAAIPGGEVGRWCSFDEGGMRAYRNLIEETRLSTRATDKLAKLARTVADLIGEEYIREDCVAGAFGLVGSDILA